MAASDVRLKLLIDTEGKRILFAEASKDFVDFLFYLFSLPLGTVVKLLKEKGTMGCLGNIYESIENLSETYMQPDQNKNSLLNPRFSTCNIGLPLLLSDHKFKTRIFYTCSPNSRASSLHYNVTDVPNLTCPHCGKIMTCEMSYVTCEGGFVKGVVTYMAMDNLEVMPMSTISSITLLNKFNVKDVGALEERIVDFRIDEGLKLLKASLESNTVLTGVYLWNSGQQKGNCA